MTTAMDLLYVEPIGGLAGDMFLAAALDLGIARGALERALGTLGVAGWRLEVSAAEAGGMRGTHVDVVTEGPQPHARALADILALVDASGLSARAKAGARAAFERIGAAEARVHGVPVEQVHFHEVGAVDSIVDVCGAAVVLDLLGWPRVVAATPELGRGFVKTAHGRLPVPPPAVLELARGMPIRLGGPAGEAVTPTGAALLATFCEVPPPGAPPPAMVPRAVGVGVGKARWSDRPNVVRLTLGTALDAETAHGGADAVFQLEANLDDCPGQLVARAIEVALEEGALDAWATPCTMKKGRPGVVLSALAPAGRRDAVARALVRETTTLGVRFRPVERLELAREHVTVETAYGPVRVKVGRLDGAVTSVHPEYEDCLAAARTHRVAVKEVQAAAIVGYRARDAST